MAQKQKIQKMLFKMHLPVNIRVSSIFISPDAVDIHISWDREDSQHRLMTNDHLGKKLTITKFQWLCLCNPNLYMLYHRYWALFINKHRKLYILYLHTYISVSVFIDYWKSFLERERNQLNIVIVGSIQILLSDKTNSKNYGKYKTQDTTVYGCFKFLEARKIWATYDSSGLIKRFKISWRFIFLIYMKQNEPSYKACKINQYYMKQ